MLTYLRYALATVCFAASAGCLALWWNWDKLVGASYFRHHYDIGITTQSGSVSVAAYKVGAARQITRWSMMSIYSWEDAWFADEIASSGSFGGNDNAVYFPLWYPALIFALVGVGALRLGRRFTLRSALIATTVVAWLLGIAVGM